MGCYAFRKSQKLILLSEVHLPDDRRLYAAPFGFGQMNIEKAHPTLMENKFLIFSKTKTLSKPFAKQ